MDIISQVLSPTYCVLNKNKISEALARTVTNLVVSSEVKAYPGYFLVVVALTDLAFTCHLSCGPLPEVSLVDGIKTYATLLQKRVVMQY